MYSNNICTQVKINSVHTRVMSITLLLNTMVKVEKCLRKYNIHNSVTQYIKEKIFLSSTIKTDSILTVIKQINKLTIAVQNFKKASSISIDIEGNEKKLKSKICKSDIK